MKNTKHFINWKHKAISCLLMVALLCGCSAQTHSTGTPSPDLLPTPTPTEQPIPGGELSLPIPRNPLKSTSGTDVQANPLLVTTDEMFNLYSLVYEPLFQCDATNKLTPCLAEKWSSDDTGRVWTVQLRKDVTWHMIDKTLDADDVLYTFNQIQTLGSESYYHFVDDAIESIEKVDANTITITMKDAGTASLYHAIFPIVCSQSVESTLIGTGPYRVKQSSDMEIELIANDRWWKQTPNIASVHCLARESNEIALASLEAGQLNMVPTSSLSVGKYREEGVTNVLDIMTQDAEMMLINYNNPVLQDIRIRKAIAHSIDRSALVSNAYMNRAMICDVPIPPDSFLYASSTKVYDYNTTLALQYFEEAGYKDVDDDGILEKINDPSSELKLTILVNDSTESTNRRSAATLIASQLAQVGVSVQVQTEKLIVGDEESKYIQCLKDGEFDLALVGSNLARNGDLSAYLKQDGARNYGMYSNSTMENLLSRALSAVDEKQMRDAYALVQQQFVDDLPFIMLYFRLNSIVYSAKIQNVTDIREPDLFRTIEKWYIEPEGD